MQVRGMAALQYNNAVLVAEEKLNMNINPFLMDIQYPN
jgi:hypothetical protein